MPFFFYSMDLQQIMLFWVYFVGRSKKCYVWLFLHASMNNGHKAQERQCFDCIRIHICFQMTCSCPWIIAFSCNLNTSSPTIHFLQSTKQNKSKNMLLLFPIPSRPLPFDSKEKSAKTGSKERCAGGLWYVAPIGWVGTILRSDWTQLKLAGHNNKIISVM